MSSKYLPLENVSSAIPPAIFVNCVKLKGTLELRE